MAEHKYWASVLNCDHCAKPSFAQCYTTLRCTSIKNPKTQKKDPLEKKVRAFMRMK